KLDPQNPAGYFRLGLLQRLTKQYDSALTNLEKARAINPRLMDVFTNIVFLHSARKDFAAALEQCDRQARVVKDSPALLAVVYNLKGEVHLAQKKIKAAETCFQDALKQNPDYLRPYYAMARIYLKNRQEDKAIAQYQALLVKNPNQVVPHMLLGTIFDMQKRFDLSEEQYRTALEINPEFAPAANNLSYLLANQDKELDEALALAQIAKEKLPDDPGVMDTLGWILYKKGLYDSAINEFTDSLGKITDNPTIHYHLGMAYYKKQNLEKARIQMEKALSLAPSFDGVENARKILSEL
ncbi:MAG: tetratricopeptide repeat protein, partial [Deltaproteobacteria bacterium]|nr:tetratricopeptide repeat protein [Deltaproteobacteria bacterium]